MNLPLAIRATVNLAIYTVVYISIRSSDCYDASTRIFSKHLIYSIRTVTMHT